MEFTNISRGPRGLNTKAGQIIVAPGQTVDVEIEKVEADGAVESKWFVKGGAPTEDPGDDIATLKAQLAERDTLIGELKAKLAKLESPAAPEAKHRGAGSYSVMDGESELREKLTKDQAEAFNALDADGKTKWLSDNPKPAA